MSARRLFNTYHDQLCIRVGLGEDIAQRDRAALPQGGHGLAECVHHGAGDRLVRGTVDSGAERCPLCLKVDGDLDSPRSHRAQMINESRGGPRSGAMPGGMRRFSRAAARGTMAAVEPSTGGQSMPSTVDRRTRPHHVGDAAAAEQVDPRRARSRRGGTARPDTRRSGQVRGVVQSANGGVALGRRARWRASRSSAANASGAAPPNIPECIAEPRLSTVTTTFAMPRRVVVSSSATPTAEVAGVRSPGSHPRAAGRRSSGRSPPARRCPVPRTPRPTDLHD